jgi:hypothetical protein
MFKFKFSKKFTTQKRKVEGTLNYFLRNNKKASKTTVYLKEHVPLFNLTLTKTEN